MILIKGPVVSKGLYPSLNFLTFTNVQTFGLIGYTRDVGWPKGIFIFSFIS